MAKRHFSKLGGKEILRRDFRELAQREHLLVPGSLCPGDWRNTRRIPYDPQNYIDAALAMNEGSASPDYGAGPTWAIFDSAAVGREEWDLEPPATDPLYFFGADTLANWLPS